MKRKKYQVKTGQENKRQKNEITLMSERRKLIDRRAYNNKQDQPVFNYRSRQPDRRINNLSVEWLAHENILIPPVLRVRYLESVLLDKTRQKRRITHT